MSVVIPVHRDASGLECTLSSLARQSVGPGRFEVVVANDGDIEEVSRVCRRHSVREVRIPRNRGSYHARNRALEETSGEYVGFVDADITVPENWIEVGREGLSRADYVGGPVIVDEAKARTPADFYEVLTGFRSNHPDSGQEFYVTANLFVTRAVFETLGGFDERLRSGGDNEFGRRLAAADRFGRRFLPHLAVLHPPRGYRELVRKKVRIARGKELLNELYPDRYGYKRTSTGRRLLNVLIPPNAARARTLSKEAPACGFASWYLFLWRFKVETALRLLPVRRRARREAETLRDRARTRT